jgi:hypothetical protein
MPAVISPHKTDVEPPLGNASESEADNAVQLLRIAKANPSIENILKFRLSSCLTPRAARWSTSAMLLLRRPALAAEARLEFIVGILVSKLENTR